jgi:hypothetical protein
LPSFSPSELCRFMAETPGASPAWRSKFAGAQHQLSHQTPELAPRRNSSDKKKAQIKLITNGS